MTKTLFACGADNDGYPQCMGDGSTCGPGDVCAVVARQEAHAKLVEQAQAVVDNLNQVCLTEEQRAAGYRFAFDTTPVDILKEEGS